jgi:hypothetical protein
LTPNVSSRCEKQEDVASKNTTSSLIGLSCQPGRVRARGTHVADTSGVFGDGDRTAQHRSSFSLAEIVGRTCLT